MLHFYKGDAGCGGHFVGCNLVDRIEGVTLGEKMMTAGRERGGCSRAGSRRTNSATLAKMHAGGKSLGKPTGAGQTGAIATVVELTAVSEKGVVLTAPD